MSTLFPNQDFGQAAYKHTELPLLITNEFDFFRCVSFTQPFYGKIIGDLHNGNLRVSRKDNRFSNLFPGQRLSYWADSPNTAKAEARRWKANNDYIMFWAYDDSSSTFPTVYPRQSLKIIDGIHEFSMISILKKLKSGIELLREEQEFVDAIAQEEPDCLAYKSEARRNGVNFLFFEHGFKKLSLRQVRLNLGEREGKNRARIICADGSDYSPLLKSYGMTFLPIAKTVYDKQYEESDEYKLRKQVLDRSYEDIRRAYNE